MGRPPSRPQIHWWDAAVVLMARFSGWLMLMTILMTFMALVVAIYAVSRSLVGR